MSAVAAAKLPAAEWQTVRLADVCQFKPPKSIPRKALEDDSPVSFVPMGDLGELTKHFEARTVRRFGEVVKGYTCLLYTSPSPRDGLLSRMPSSA